MRKIYVKNIGIIVRTFAMKESDIPRRCDMAVALVRKAAAINVPNQLGRFKLVEIVVWSDPRFNSDCGKTAAALRERMQAEGLQQHCRISEEKKGDLYCGLLNRAVVKQVRAGCDFSMIISPESGGYLTQENFESMWNAFAAGANVAGMAISEITDSILEGRIGNAFSMWDNLALIGVGGFDMRAAKPHSQIERFHPSMRGMTPDGREVAYHLAGVEEMIPLARLVSDFGQCIAPILPSNESMRYKEPDPKTQPELAERHRKKIATKLERQTALLQSIGMLVSWVKGGVMKDYRNPRVFD